MKKNKGIDCLISFSKRNDTEFIYLKSNIIIKSQQEKNGIWQKLPETHCVTYLLLLRIVMKVFNHMFFTLRRFILDGKRIDYFRFNYHLFQVNSIHNRKTHPHVVQRSDLTRKNATNSDSFSRYCDLVINRTNLLAIDVSIYHAIDAMPVWELLKLFETIWLTNKWKEREN